MKIKVLVGLAVLVGASLLLTFPLFDRGVVYFKEKTEVLKEGECIEGFASPVSDGHFITDEIEYRVTVVYCDKIEVDEERIMRSVELAPFDVVGNAKISENLLSGGVNRLVLTYTIQAIDVFPGEEYTFEPILVEYSYKDTDEEGVYRITKMHPIYISRMTPPSSLSSIQDAEFRPLKPELATRAGLFSQAVIITVGGIILVLGFVGTVYVFKPKKAIKAEKETGYLGEILMILDSIESESDNDARAAMHRLYNLISEVSRYVPPPHRETLRELNHDEVSAHAYGREEPESKDVLSQTEAFREILSKIPKHEFPETYKSTQIGGGDN